MNKEEEEKRQYYTIRQEENYHYKFKINNVTIKDEIFQEEEFNYRIEEREEIINNLFMWISENNKDKELMKDDLQYLMSLDDKYIFSSILTNEYIAKSDNEKEFNDLCKELLELNEDLRE